MIKSQNIIYSQLSIILICDEIRILLKKKKTFSNNFIRFQISNHFNEASKAVRKTKLRHKLQQ